MLRSRRLFNKSSSSVELSLGKEDSYKIITKPAHSDFVSEPNFTMRKYLDKLQQQRVVIIGGSSGIGFAVAEAAIEHGAKVTIASSAQAKVDDAVRRLKQAYPGAEVRGRTIDLKSVDKVEQGMVALFDLASDDNQNQIDHVAYTAGDTLEPVLLQDITPTDILSSFHVRLVGPMIAAKVALRYMKASVKSSFTITGGVGDERPTPGRGTLAPVGGAVKALGNALANEMRPVRANVVCPGPVETGMYDFLPTGKREETFEIFKERTLTRTLGKPEDLAEVYLSLMKNSFVTGSRYNSDGGYLLTK